MEEYKILESRPDKRKTMRVKEFCEIYGVGFNKAYNLAHSANAPVIFNGRKILFIRSKTDEWIESLIGQQI